MTVKMIENDFFNKNGLSSDEQNFQANPFFYDEVDLHWISEKAQQDLNPVEINQLLPIIDDFMKRKTAEIKAEMQLVEAFKAELIRKLSVLSEK